MDTPESYSTDFLLNNLGTLISLSLYNIYLDSPLSWVQICDMIILHLHLQTAYLHGNLCDRVDKDAAYPYTGLGDGWDVDASNLSVLLGTYLVKGGPCPLKHNLKEGVLDGRICRIAGRILLCGGDAIDGFSTCRLSFMQV